MDRQPQHFIVSVRFSKVGKLYHFEADKNLNLVVGDQVVVETARGWQLGEIAQILGDVTDNSESSWKAIDRKATDEDLRQRKDNEDKEKNLLDFCRSEIRNQNLEGLKAVSIEYSLDSSKISILYSFDGDNKIDLRNLKHEISKKVPDAQVELRQIGPRGVAKIFGGMGACGLPTRCCTKFLTDFSSISIRMAKEQGISLTPTEITGMCGRLRCCLIYEYELYAENRKQLPKRNKRVVTPLGEGKVVDVLPLKMAVVVDIPEVGRKEFFNSDIQLSDGVSKKSVETKDNVVEKSIEPDQPSEPEKSDEPHRSQRSETKRPNRPVGKGRKPKWRKKRPSNQNKKNE
jgi:cell fate regulator YaaT (PSP1 superfamily)